MRLLNGVLGMALLGLAACAELGIQLPDLRGSQAAPTTPVAAEQALSNAGRFPEDVTQQAAKPLPPLPVRKPPVPVDVREATPAPEVDPDALVGLDFERASALLGAPAMLIDEPPAKIWAYNGTNCVLHVFFYPKVGGSDFRVLTYEAKGGPEGSATRAGEPARTAEAKAFARSCLNELLAQAGAGRAGAEQPSAQPTAGTAGGS